MLPHPPCQRHRTHRLLFRLAPLPNCKHLSKAQKSLGQLNDGARGSEIAAELEHKGVQSSLKFLKPKREKRLLKRASKAYRKLKNLG